MLFYKTTKRGTHINFFSINAELDTEAGYTDIKDRQALNPDNFIFSVNDDVAITLICPIFKHVGLSFNLHDCDKYTPKELKLIISELNILLYMTPSKLNKYFDTPYTVNFDKDYLQLIELLEHLKNSFQISVRKNLHVIADDF
jgi:hypothetical protein